MADARVGQVGNGTVTILDASGNPTDDWDVQGGIDYQSSAPDVVSIRPDDDTPDDPKDSIAEALALGQATLTCTFDGRVGPDEKMITLQAMIDVVPGAAAGGAFEFVWEDVSEPQPQPEPEPQP